MKVLLATAAALVLAGPALAAPETSFRFSDSSWLQDDDAFLVIADGFPASLRANQAYIPVPVAVGRRARGELPAGIRFTTESFRLIAPDGTQYPVAGWNEVSTGYDMLSFDRVVLRGRPLVVGQKFTNSHEVSSRFFPPPGRQTRTDDVELGAFTWFADVLYFPKPSEPLTGVWTLRVLGNGMKDPVEVRFRFSETNPA